MMRSSHCPFLVRIQSNTDFLSRFQSVVTGVTKIGDSTGKEPSLFPLRLARTEIMCVYDCLDSKYIRLVSAQNDV